MSPSPRSASGGCSTLGPSPDRTGCGEQAQEHFPFFLPSMVYTAFLSHSGRREACARSVSVMRCRTWAEIVSPPGKITTLDHFLTIFDDVLTIFIADVQRMATAGFVRYQRVTGGYGNRGKSPGGL
jgi:hypothetical protein